MLSPRESVIEQNRQARRQIIAEANNRISIHPVLEIPPRFTHNQRSPQPVTRRAANRVADAPEDDVDRISLLADADSSADAPIVIVRHASSPYAQRRHGSGAATPVATGLPPAADIQIVDDHYSGGGAGRMHSRRVQPDQSSGSASENSSTAFTMID